MLLFNQFSFLFPSANKEGDCCLPEQWRGLGRESKEVAGEWTSHFCAFFEQKPGALLAKKTDSVCMAAGRVFGSQELRRAREEMAGGRGEPHRRMLPDHAFDYSGRFQDPQRQDGALISPELRYYTMLQE